MGDATRLLPARHAHMLALVLSMGPPGTIPAPSQVSRPALRNRARAQVATPSGGPQDDILAPGPSHISRARRDVTSPCAPRAQARRCMLSMGPPGTIPAPSPVSRPALRNRAPRSSCDSERGPAGRDPGAQPQSHQSRETRRDFSLRATRHARLGAAHGPTGHDPGALSDQRAVRSACSQLKSSNVPYAPRAVNQRSQTCRTLCVRSMCVSSPRPTYDRSTCVSSPRLTYDRSTCVSSTRLTCASEECVSSQGLTYWLPQAATSDAMRIESCVCAPQKGSTPLHVRSRRPPSDHKMAGEGFRRAAV